MIARLYVICLLGPLQFVAGLQPRSSKPTRKLPHWAAHLKRKNGTGREARRNKLIATTAEDWSVGSDDGSDDDAASEAETRLESFGKPKPDVEEKFEKYFGYLARCEGKFCTTTLNFLKIKPKSTKMLEKCRQNLKIDLWEPYLEI